jgi:dienelactone hydrolase
LFRYFPDNYMWSLSFMRCLNSGGLLGELHRIGRRLQAVAGTPPVGDLEAWYNEWYGLAQQVEGYARAAEDQGHPATAADAYFRATHYYQWAVTFQPTDDPRRRPTYQRHLDAFHRFASLGEDGVEIVEVPYEGRSLPAYFVPARAEASRPTPAVVYFGGLDSCKEELYPLAAALRRRSVSCLVVDGPGQGEALKLRGLVSRHDYEVPAAAAYDYLVGRGDVDPSRIGLVGISMGGYYAGRALAFEKRFKVGVAWSGQYDYRQTWVRRLDIRPGAPISAPPHHVFEVLGVASWEEVLKRLEPYSLRGVAREITCPFLIVHGEDDRQILLQDALALYKEVGTEEKELRIFTDQEGGSAHCQIDCKEPGLSFVADWLADRLAR